MQCSAVQFSAVQCSHLESSSSLRCVQLPVVRSPALTEKPGVGREREAREVIRLQEELLYTESGDMARCTTLYTIH